MSGRPAVEVRRVGDDDWCDVDRLVHAYLSSLPFEVTFQDVDRELADLPGQYGPPHGAALLAWLDGAAVGVVGIRRFSDEEAELKRMYVDPAARGHGAGRLLAAAAIDAASALGYRRLLLDTEASMTAAIALYEALGFRPIPAYRHNPLPGARYFARDL